MGILATELSIPAFPAVADVFSVTSSDSPFSSVRYAPTTVQTDSIRFVNPLSLSSFGVFLDDVVWPGVQGPS